MPCTSKEGNSEVYIIATDYRKTETNASSVSSLRSFVYDQRGDFHSAAAFPLDRIARTFLSDAIECATTFKDLQESVILRNLTLYNLPEDLKELNRLQHAVAVRFLDRYQLKAIQPDRQLVGLKKLRAAPWKV